MIADKSSLHSSWKRSVFRVRSRVAGLLISEQRLMGASLLVFSNKTDVGGCMTDDEIRKVILTPLHAHGDENARLTMVRGFSLTELRRTNGQSFVAAQSLEVI